MAKSSGQSLATTMRGFTISRPNSVRRSKTTVLRRSRKTIRRRAKAAAIALTVTSLGLRHSFFLGTMRAQSVVGVLPFHRQTKDDRGLIHQSAGHQAAAARIAFLKAAWSRNIEVSKKRGLFYLTHVRVLPYFTPI